MFIVDNSTQCDLPYKRKSGGKPSKIVGIPLLQCAQKRDKYPLYATKWLQKCDVTTSVATHTRYKMRREIRRQKCWLQSGDNEAGRSIQLSQICNEVFELIKLL